MKKEKKDAVIYIRVTASTKKKWERFLKKYSFYSPAEIVELMMRRFG